MQAPGKLLFSAAPWSGSAAACLMVKWLCGVSFCLKRNRESGICWKIGWSSYTGPRVWGAPLPANRSPPLPGEREARGARGRESALGSGDRRDHGGGGVAGGKVRFFKDEEGSQSQRSAAAFASGCPRPCGSRAHRRRWRAAVTLNPGRSPSHPSRPPLRSPPKTMQTPSVVLRAPRPPPL